MAETQHKENGNGLIGIFNILWKRRRLIIIGTMAVTVIAVVYALLLPRVYMSKAVISLSAIKKLDQDELPKSMELPVFRRYSDTFQNSALFLRYSKLRGYKAEWHFEDWEVDEQFFESHFKPIYAFETEKLGVKVVDNSIMGIIVQGEEDSPQKAKAQTEILGSYLLTTILNMQIGHYIESISIKSQATIVQAKKAIINLERETTYLREKESLIENQLLKLPGMNQQMNRELVTADANSEKYLSPQQQLISVKMSIKENQIQIERHLKTTKVDQLMLDYVDKIKHLMAKEKDFLVNESLLDTMIVEKNNFFAGKVDNENKLASYTFTWQFFYFQKLRSLVYKFISGPTLPAKHFKPKRKRIVIGAFFLGFFIFTLLAFGVETWGHNKKYANHTPST